MQRLTKTVLSLLGCCSIAGCASTTPSIVAAPRDLTGMKLAFTDLHSANTYEFLPGGHYRFAALSQNRLRADSREGTFAYRASGRTAQLALDNDAVMRLVFADAANGTCTVADDVRIYTFRLSRAD